MMTSLSQGSGRVLRRYRAIAHSLSVAALTAGALVSPTAHAASPKTFASPEQASDALDAAWRSGDTSRILAIFGPAADKLVRSGDPVAEKRALEMMASSYDETHRLDGVGTSKVVIILGKDAWPYPIPLVKIGARWRFDVQAGAEQIIDRRIGRNEMNVIAVCRGYVEAQRDYAMKDRLGDGLHEYAQKIASSEGRHDGLYWQASQGEDESPLGPLVASAEAQGYGPPQVDVQPPFHGYFFRILTKQGKSAPGGAKDYIVNGHLKGGFALVAFPAAYGNSGVMTFVVNQNGIVFEKNLGVHTADAAQHLTEYDPDKSWKMTQP